MSNNATTYLQLLFENAPLLIIAACGGFVLFGLKIADHFVRAATDKYTPIRYAGVFVSLFVALPLLGCVVAGIYIVNGDKLSPILAFQVGLTSPAIVQSLIVVAANQMAAKTAEVAADQ